MVSAFITLLAAAVMASLANGKAIGHDLSSSGVVRRHHNHVAQVRHVNDTPPARRETSRSSPGRRRKRGVCAAPSSASAHSTSGPSTSKAAAAPPSSVSTETTKSPATTEHTSSSTAVATTAATQPAAVPTGSNTMTVGVTPHASYSSSIGVLGCKVDVNRIAYFPTTPDCNNMCLQVTHGAQTLNLLHIDQSGGAYDISYDAWNYLYTGKSATVAPVAGGAIDMQVTPVDMSHCLPILNGTNTAGKLPLSASNSMDYYANCVSEPSSWAASNMLLLNILDSQCHFGYDEICTIDLATSNQATCPHQLGLNTALTTEPVYNIQYSSGTLALA